MRPALAVGGRRGATKWNEWAREMRNGYLDHARALLVPGQLKLDHLRAFIAPRPGMRVRLCVAHSK